MSEILKLSLRQIDILCRNIAWDHQQRLRFEAALHGAKLTGFAEEEIKVNLSPEQEAQALAVVQDELRKKQNQRS